MSDNDNIIYFFQNGMKSQPRNHQLSNLRFSWPSHPVSCFHQCLVLCQAWMSQSLSCAQSLGIWERCFFFLPAVLVYVAEKLMVGTKRFVFSKWKEHRFYPTSGCLGLQVFVLKGCKVFFDWNVGTNVNQSAYQFSIHHGMLLFDFVWETPPLSSDPDIPWLFIYCILVIHGDFTTQSCTDFLISHEIRIPWTNQDFHKMSSCRGCVAVAHLTRHGSRKDP